MDLGKAGGVPVPIDIAGKTYRIKPQTMRMLSDITVFAQSKLKNPIVAVVQAFNDPAVRERDREAQQDILAYEYATAAIATAAKTPQAEGQQPAPADPVDSDLRTRAALAQEWKAQKRQLMLDAYRDAYSPPQLGSDVLAPIVQSLEGVAYELWLGLRAVPENLTDFPDHLSLMERFRTAPMGLIELHARYAELSSENPGGNS